ncbi:hypothetical protein DY000_02051583 [Brassica cretica]|uniref:Uncharacterized protein n=1 Tax=Brassica cretica TaxID=69181 RepID=A0ABQ7F3H4_BRACR|nr:hypothetical protein DY000_02051583 [Brassica cretica]
MVLESFLNEILPTYNSWKTKYVAGNNSGLQSQTRKKQNETVEDFRKGLVNIIVSTSILEEGLDVQSCNLVVGFDPASTICSFIQSQGRARMPNSDYLMMVESRDMQTQSRLKKYISGAKRMREDSLSHSLVPCQPLPDDSSGEVYRVDSTGAIVTHSSSVSLIYFYCSRLPSDEYFKPTPRFDIDKDQGNCTLYLPKSCQVKEVKFQGNENVLKQAVCLKACIQLHQAGALTDHLVPDMVLKETVQQKLGSFAASSFLDFVLCDKPLIYEVLEAITTKKCQDQFHLESLETLGDSFLKYAVCQHLFQEYHTHHEGLLSSIKDGMISNVTLCKFGCDQKLQGFIRNECFEPKGWMVPGQSSAAYGLVNDHLSESTNMYIPRRKNMYIARRRNLKRKSVADVVEALIGAYLSEGGELAALTFMNWVGIKVDFTTTMIQREPSIQAEKLVNVSYMESLLNYKFKDKSLLVEALTHGSYMIPEIPRCYQRLEFLGDSVLDYLITKHLYGEYPNLSPGLLTDMRSASVNNECYAQVAVKSNLHKHVLHASHDLHKHISRTVGEFERLSSVQSSFGWESEIAFPKSFFRVWTSSSVFTSRFRFFFFPLLQVQDL